MLCTYLTNDRPVLSDIQRIFYGIYRSVSINQPFHIFCKVHCEPLIDIIALLKSDVTIHTLHQEDIGRETLEVNVDKLTSFAKNKVRPLMWYETDMSRAPSICSGEKYLVEHIDLIMKALCDNYIVICDTQSDLPYLYSQSGLSEYVCCLVIKYNDGNIEVCKNNINSLCFSAILSAEKYVEFNDEDLYLYHSIIDVIKQKNVDCSEFSHSGITSLKEAVSMVKYRSRLLCSPYIAPEIARESIIRYKESITYIKNVIDSL